MADAPLDGPIRKTAAGGGFRTDWMAGLMDYDHTKSRGGLRTRPLCAGFLFGLLGWTTHVKIARPCGSAIHMHLNIVWIRAAICRVG